MDKIIGGENTDFTQPVRLSKKILWPCYEFIVDLCGVFRFNKNILEDVILKFANIGVTDVAELSQSMGFSLPQQEIISFIQGRLQQKGYLDAGCHITKDGEEILKSTEEENLEENHELFHIYVDAISGELIPYYESVNEENEFHYKDGYFGDNGYFCYKEYYSAGKESEELIKAYVLHQSLFDVKPPSNENVELMLRQCNSVNNGIRADVPQDQICGSNRCYMLLDIALLAGNMRHWLISDGFGDISTFFNLEKISDSKDKDFVQSLYNFLKKQTNEKVSEKLFNVKLQKYPKLAEKFQILKMGLQLAVTPDSTDAALRASNALQEAIKALYQLLEWSMWYFVQEQRGSREIDIAMTQLNSLGEINSGRYIIGKRVVDALDSLGVKMDEDEEMMLSESFGAIRASMQSPKPSLIALLDLIVVSFEKASWLKLFLEKNQMFFQDILRLKNARDQAFHRQKSVASKEDLLNIQDIVFEFVHSLLKIDLNEISAGSEITEDSSEYVQEENARIDALNALNNKLGYASCKKLDFKVFQKLIEMEQHTSNNSAMMNVAVLDQYQLLENIFRIVNQKIDGNPNRDWHQMAHACGFKFNAGSSDFAALVSTSPERIERAVNRKNSSMNAAVIAFIKLSNTELLRKIAIQWPDMLQHVSYLTEKRGHGEISDDVDEQMILKIKEYIYKVVIFFISKGFLLTKVK